MFLHCKLSVCLLFVLCLQYIAVTQAKPESDDKHHKHLYDLNSIFKIVLKLPFFFQEAVELWEFFEGIYDKYGRPDGPALDTDARIGLLDKKIDKLSDDLRTVKDIVSTKIERSADKSSLLNKIDKLAEYLEHIKTNYFRFRTLTETHYLNPYDISDFADEMTSNNDGLSQKLNLLIITISQTLVSNKNVFGLLSDPGLAHELMCERHLSAQLNIYFLYQHILIAQARGYVMLKFSRALKECAHNLLTPEREKNLTSEINTEFNNRLYATHPQVFNAMRIATREMWRCTTLKLKEGHTYARLNTIFQKSVLREVEADPDYEKKLNQDDTGCELSCNKISDRKQYYNKFGLTSKIKTCRGFLRDCKAEQTQVTVCNSEAVTYKRYDYIVIDDMLNGPWSDSCESKQTDKEYASVYAGLGPVPVIPYPLAYGVDTCEICICTCDESLNSEKEVSFDLRPVVSDFYNNKVITGIRIDVTHPPGKPNAQIIQFSIMEGDLLRHARVNNSYEAKIQRRVSNDKLNYHTITWDQRTICLDVVDYQKNDRVLTGVQFEFHDNAIQVGILMTYFDGTTGRLNPKDSIWYQNPDGKNRRKLDIQNLELPFRGGVNEDRSQPGDCIKFELSGMKYDAGQTVVPLIETLMVAPNPPAPLSGFGLYLRGAIESSGFLAPKLVTYDYSVSMEKPQLFGEGP